LGKDEAAQENDCLGGDSIITVRDIKTNKIKEITLEEFYNECKTC